MALTIEEINPVEPMFGQLWDKMMETLVTEDTPAEKRPSPPPQRPFGAYTGDACTGCGNFMMRRAGTCLLCDVCGTTTGCS
jgi:formate hydrogenlyase subunit 6/NADH:ubiquinone oxidoreductase subunit I